MTIFIKKKKIWFTLVYKLLFNILCLKTNQKTNVGIKYVYSGNLNFKKTSLSVNELIIFIYFVQIKECSEKAVLLLPNGQPRSNQKTIAAPAQSKPANAPKAVSRLTDRNKVNELLQYNERFSN